MCQISRQWHRMESSTTLLRAWLCCWMQSFSAATRMSLSPGQSQRGAAVWPGKEGGAASNSTQDDSRNLPVHL